MTSGAARLYSKSTSELASVMEKTNLFNRLLKSLSEDQGFVTPGSGGVIHLTPYLSLIVAILYMMAADDEISDQECNHLLSVFGGDQQILQRALKYVESKSVDEFLAEVPEVVEGENRLCILLNVCDSSMSDGEFAKSEMILFSRMLSVLGYDRNSFKPYFETISLKNKHSVFGDVIDAAGGEMTPSRALVVSMLYMMSVDGDMAKEEIGHINSVLRGSKNVLPEALKYVKRTKFPDFMSAVSSILNHQQKSCILVNVVDCMLSDGRVDRLEQDLFRRMLAGFNIAESDFKKHFSHLTIKNDRPVDIRKASKSDKKGEVIRNTINTDEQKQFADGSAGAVKEATKAAPTSMPATKMANDIVNKLEKNVESFQSQAESAGGMNLMAANARAAENDSAADTMSSSAKKALLESGKNQVKKSPNTSAAAGASSRKADGPMDDRRQQLRNAQGVSDIRNLSDAEGGESDTRRLRDGQGVSEKRNLRDAEGGESDSRRLRDGQGVSDKRNLRDAEGGESDSRSLRDAQGVSDIRNLRDAEDGESDSRSLRDAQSVADKRNLRDAEDGESDTRRLRDAEGAIDRRSARDSQGESDMRRSRDAEGDVDIRSARDAKGDSDMRRLRDAEGEAERRELADGDGDDEKRQLRNAKGGGGKRHLRDADGESDLRRTSDGDGDFDLRAAEDGSAGPKSRHLRDATSGGGKKLTDSDSENEVIVLQDDQGAHDAESHLNVRMDYLKTWTGSLKDNLDEFEAIDASHTSKRATALEMVTIRPDRPAVLALALTNSPVQTITQAREDDIAIRPLARNIDMTERHQQIATESATAPVVDKTRKVLAALTTGLIITQGFSSYGLSEAQNTFMTNQMMASTTHMSVETLTVQQGAFNMTADLMDHIVSKNEGYSSDLRELSKTSAETYRTQAQKIESGTEGNESKPSLKDKIKVYENKSAIQLLKLKWFGLANGILMLGFFLSFFGLFFKSKMSVTGSSVVFILGTLVTLNGFFLFI
jgi:uncharacterized tellurite resistance protein B-like protein